MAVVKWQAPTNRGALLAGETLAAGANLLSSELQNETNQDRWVNIELAWTCASASSAGTRIDVYAIYRLNASFFEDGDETEDPPEAPIGHFYDDAGTGAQKQALTGIRLEPKSVKFLLKSELDQNATAVTLDVEITNEESS